MLPVSDTNPSHEVAYFRARGAQEAANGLEAVAPEAKPDFIAERLRQNANDFSNFIDDVIVGNGRKAGEPIPTDEALEDAYKRSAVQRYTGALDYLHAVHHGITPRIRRVQSLNRIVHAMESGQAEAADFSFFHDPHKHSAARPDATPVSLGYHLLESNPELKPKAEIREDASIEAQPEIRELLDTLLALPAAERSAHLRARINLGFMPTLTAADEAAIENVIARHAPARSRNTVARGQASRPPQPETLLQNGFRLPENLPPRDRIWTLLHRRDQRAELSATDEASYQNALQEAQNVLMDHACDRRLSVRYFIGAIEPLPLMARKNMLLLLRSALPDLSTHEAEAIERELESVTTRVPHVVESPIGSLS